MTEVWIFIHNNLEEPEHIELQSQVSLDDSSDQGNHFGQLHHNSQTSESLRIPFNSRYNTCQSNHSAEKYCSTCRILRNMTEVWIFIHNNLEEPEHIELQSQVSLDDSSKIRKLERINSFDRVSTSPRTSQIAPDQLCTWGPCFKR
eukprot:TRINITY_DN1985_c1_g1_i2.p1 TRINITY_DN1985_c1_g1~~TRINITY_DN1985_c1_g1_i2.p1  ORF type:complete len:146 (+),score=28.02 TRINITY_DN1985_c1_g1_i2:263-700(+)